VIPGSHFSPNTTSSPTSCGRAGESSKAVCCVQNREENFEQLRSGPEIPEEVRTQLEGYRKLTARISWTAGSQTTSDGLRDQRHV
jgi:hypothetical protein